jgi:hypothetical protein
MTFFYFFNQINYFPKYCSRRKSSWRFIKGLFTGVPAPQMAPNGQTTIEEVDETEMAQMSAEEDRRNGNEPFKREMSADLRQLMALADEKSANRPSSLNSSQRRRRGLKSPSSIIHTFWRKISMK